MIKNINTVMFDSSNNVERISIMDMVDRINELVDVVNSLEVEKKFNFESGDKVLTRQSINDKWIPNIYFGYFYGGDRPYMCDGLYWKYCIPFDIDKWGTV